MRFLEKNLEDIIYEADLDSLHSRGLTIHGKRLRQVKIGNYGIADLITIERDVFNYAYAVQDTIKPFITVTVFELKKEIVNIHTFLQAVKYLKGIKRYLAHRGF